MSEIELKPCPFCGSEDIRIYCDGWQYFLVICNKCGVVTNFHTREKEMAIEAWNNRAYEE